MMLITLAQFNRQDRRGRQARQEMHKSQAERGLRISISDRQAAINSALFLGVLGGVGGFGEYSAARVR
jgi:hypothetical protein